MATGCFALITENSLNNSQRGGSLWVGIFVEAVVGAGCCCGLAAWLTETRVCGSSVCLRSRWPRPVIWLDRNLLHVCDGQSSWALRGLPLVTPVRLEGCMWDGQLCCRQLKWQNDTISWNKHVAGSGGLRCSAWWWCCWGFCPFELYLELKPVPLPGQ